jgi:hypothetical protein
MKKILIIILFISNNICGNPEIVIKNFGIITIGNGNNYLGKHIWKLSFKNEDSLFIFSIKTKTNEKYVFFNLSKLLNAKYLKYLKKNETNFLIIKDEKIIFNETTKINFTPKNLFNIYIEKKLNIKGLKGKIIDSYALDNIDNDYYLIRTILNNKLLCWSIVKNNKIMNVHTEMNVSKHHNLGRITITNFTNENKPEFTFIYKDSSENKIITLGEKNKYISSFFKNNIYVSRLSKKYNMLEYRGFIYYTFKNNG